MNRVKSVLAVALALVGIPAASQAGRAIAPEDAPKAWVVYAQAATRAVAGWLSSDAPQAVEVRALLDRTRPAADQAPPAPIEVRLWVGKDGLVTRAELPQLADEQAGHALKALIIGRALGRPPKGMRQPMRLGLGFPPEEASKSP